MVKKFPIECIVYNNLMEKYLEKLYTGQAQWLTPIISALWEAEAGGSQGQEMDTILVNKVKPRLY